MPTRDKNGENTQQTLHHNKTDHKFVVTAFESVFSTKKNVTQMRLYSSVRLWGLLVVPPGECTLT